MSRAQYQKILIANRGEIAVRVIRACQEMGIHPVAVYSDVDRNSRHVQLASEAWCLGKAPASESYLNVDKILDVAQQARVEAIHPGYGFLSENIDFARRCQKVGIDFIGPSTETIELMGSKIASKTSMEAAGVPVVPGYYGQKQDDQTLTQKAEEIGYPLLVKASAGGGGKGMRIVNTQEDIPKALAAARRESKAAFGDDTLFLEKYFTSVRHIEFQILGDRHGNLLHLFERECSLQRRHQKVIEETPSTALSSELREKMATVALMAARAVNYYNAGTVEMLLDAQNNFYFLEMNTRLQVEHPVTEMTLGIDLVKEQIRVTAGHPLTIKQNDLKPQGHAIEARIYAENPENKFLPTTGIATLIKEPSGQGIRLDSALYSGMEVSPYYDPLLAKLIAHGTDRAEAISRLRHALDEMVILGVTTNISYLKQILAHPDFIAGQIDTRFLETHSITPPKPPILPSAILAAVEFGARRSAPLSIGDTSDRFSPWLNIGHWGF